MERKQIDKHFENDFAHFRFDTMDILNLVRLLSFLHWDFFENENYPENSKYKGKMYIISLCNIIEKYTKSLSAKLEEIHNVIINHIEQ